jgi:transposase
VRRTGFRTNWIRRASRWETSSGTFGVSGQQILRSLLNNEALSAEQMADLAKKRLRNRIPELTEALRDHRMNDHRRWLIQQSAEHAQFPDLHVESVEKKIGQQMERY